MFLYNVQIILFQYQMFVYIIQKQNSLTNITNNIFNMRCVCIIYRAIWYSNAIIINIQYIYINKAKKQQKAKE